MYRRAAMFSIVNVNKNYIKHCIIVRRNISVKSFRDYNSDDYQFLHKSEIPTYHFQKSLRRLAIPKLEKSCERYLEAVKAVCNEEEVKETEKLVDEFLKGEGPELQKALVQYDRQNPLTSYISEPWFDMYLSARVPCPINCNPFMMFAPDPEPAYNNQLIRATNFVISCARFKRSLDWEVLAPEIFHLNPTKSDTQLFRRFCRILPPSLSWFGAAAFKAFPLDMSQYTSLFGGCRIPQRNKDYLSLKNSNHFVVIRNGHFYSVQLFDNNFNPKIHRSDHIFAALYKILNNTESPPKPEECVGSLTTLDRDTWADVRSELINSDRQNFNSLTAIENALFVLCLDDITIKDPTRLVQSLLCGDDGRNRWFDKCFQLIIDGIGQATINFEHSWGDGVAVLRLMEETLKDTIKHRFVEIEQKPQIESIPNDFLKKLEWNLSDSLRNHIQNAQEKNMKHCQNIDFGVLEHKSLSKSTIKAARISPDAIMQLAIQMAYHSLYNEFVPTYESCSTAAFLKGRTECIRSATTATREIVKAFKSDNGHAELMSLLQKCSAVHSTLIKDCSMGQGFDRHLFGLICTAKRLNMPYPRLFINKVYERMGQFFLSTSTLSTDTIYFGGFGPAVPNGFGIAYNVTDEKLGFAVTAYKDKRNAAKFCAELDVALNKIRNVIETSINSKEQ